MKKTKIEENKIFVTQYEDEYERRAAIIAFLDKVLEVSTLDEDLNITIERYK